VFHILLCYWPSVCPTFMAALRLDRSCGSCSSYRKAYCLRKRSALYRPLRSSNRGSFATLWGIVQGCSDVQSLRTLLQEPAGAVGQAPNLRRMAVGCATATGHLEHMQLLPCGAVAVVVTGHTCSLHRLLHRARAYAGTQQVLLHSVTFTA